MSQKSEIINKACKLGLIDGYVNDSELETLQVIARKVGMSSYDVRIDSDNIALNEKVDQFATKNNKFNDINYKIADYTSEKIKEKSIQNKIEEGQKKGAYYNNPVEALRRRQEELRASKIRDVNNSEQSTDEDSNSNDNKNSNKENLEKNENLTKDNSNNQKSIQNRVNDIKKETNRIIHPIKSTEEEVKAKAKKKVKTLLLKYWWVFALAALIFLLFIIIMLIIIGSVSGDDSTSTQTSYTDSQYDFTETVVFLTNSYQNESEKVNITTLSLEDLVEGFVYSEFNNKLDGKSEQEKLEIFKTALIVGNSLALSIGNYDAATKEISIQSGQNGLPYCDIYNGCKVINSNGLNTYVSSTYTGILTGSVVTTIEAMSADDQKLLTQAYSEVKNLLLVPNSVNTVIEKFTYGNVPYTQEIKQKWITYAENNSDYKDIIYKTNEYAGYKIYDITEYAMQYSYTEGNSYWWPIGSSSADSNGLYSGEPMGTHISSKYGQRTIQGVTKFHSGVDISGSCSKYIIIASKSGTVSYAHDGCPTKGSYGDSCGGGYGNNVKIDHGDGTMTVYAHMAQGSIVVKEKQQVRQGEMIGLMGSSGSSTGCHLHFEVRVNGSRVDPLDYISSSNTRPVAASSVQAGYESGNNNMQTVCLSLKQSGYSNSAVAAIMTNMKSESSFNPTAVGDSGTSYGLCQWHNGRYANLKSYCGSEYSTIKCQISYLIKELKQSYIKVNNYLGTNNSAWEMTRYYCYYFEKPASRETSCKNRANNSAQYENYVNNNCS